MRSYEILMTNMINSQIQHLSNEEYSLESEDLINAYRRRLKQNQSNRLFFSSSIATLIEMFGTVALSKVREDTKGYAEFGT